MQSQANSNRLLAKAFREQSDELLNQFLELAEKANLGDTKSLHVIGDWHRLMVLERLEGFDIFVDEAEKKLLGAYYEWKRTGVDNGLGEQRIQQIKAWNQASIKERTIGFGICALLRPTWGAGTETEHVFLYRLSIESLAYLDFPDADAIEIAMKRANAKRLAEKLHDKPDGSRAKRARIKALWATGKYSSRSICAEQECGALNMSYDTARKALIGEPNPS